jgi:esterase/lipase
MSMISASQDIRPPSRLLAYTELHRAFFELSSLPVVAPLLMSAPRGDGHPVLVLPGFVTSDRSTRILRRYLADQGYDVHAWELGRNLGPKAIGDNGEKLLSRLRAIHRNTGRKVSLVGWSLGGVMARELARREPHMVRQVISLGSPFTGDPRATNVARLYERLTGDRLDGEALQARLAESRKAPPVPSTSIYSKADGVTSWRNCIEPASERTDNIEVHGSHCGLGVNPAVLYAVADRLAQPEGRWARFERSGWRAAVYPSSGHLH